MGLFSWARRGRPSAASSSDSSAPGWDGVPIGGLLGAPDRRAPAQDPASTTMPTAMSTDRLRGWFARHGYACFTDADGDVGGLWRGRLFYFFLFGEHHEILQVRGQWNREFAIERMAELLDLCNEWNAERVWPKAYVRVRDDGMVHAVCEVATDLEHGVTEDQLGQLLHCGLTSASAFFDELDDRYPDPAASAP
ncbi:MAG TPA: YbjN domain-containing protein [Actinotalea sp.]|nr:YbjN domain-containing protein [Actinotalea sp.]